MTERFAGKTAIVTGASRGIGLAIAKRLVAGGGKVVITARTAEPLENALELLGGPQHALGVAGRADDAEHQTEAVELAVASFGSADLLVNNAGINPASGPLVESKLDAARAIFEVNCLAALAWAMKTHKVWMGEHGGAIVNVSSASGIRPAPGIGLYGASKAMLNHITEGLAVELGPTVRVNAVAPAVVKTSFTFGVYRGREEELAGAYPLKRLGVPEDVAGAVAFLLSDEAAWITGHVLVVDGGLTLTRGS